MDRHVLLQEAYRGFNARDADAVVAMMTPDVDWPNGMEGGRILGPDAVRAYWLRQWSLIDPHVEPLRLKDEPDGRIAVHVRQVVKNLEGAILQDRILDHVYTFAGEKIASMQIRE